MGREKITFEVKSFHDEQGRLTRGIFIDGRHFDWGVDEDSYKEAVAMGSTYQQAIEQDIARHFLESISEFINRRVTMEEVQEATRTGLIDK